MMLASIGSAGARRRRRRGGGREPRLGCGIEGLARTPSLVGAFGAGAAIRAGRRTAAALALALLAAACGNDDVASPTAPDPVGVAGDKRLLGIDVVNAPRDGLLVGSTVRLEVHGTYNDGAKRIELATWISSAPAVASVDAGGAVRGLAVGVATITATVREHRAAAMIEVRSSGVDDRFWRQFAFNEYDCPTRANCKYGTGHSEYRDLEERRLWRLPTPSPDFFLADTSLGPFVDQIRETIPPAVSQLTGVPYAGRIYLASLDLQERGGDNQITIEGVTPADPPASPACLGMELGTVGGRVPGGRAKVGALRGCIVLNMEGRRSLPRSVIMHEIGHALGFWHTDNSSDLMYGGGSPALGGFSPLEQHHGRFAYTRPRGATYADTIRTFGPRSPPRAPSPFEHGGIAVD